MAKKLRKGLIAVLLAFVLACSVVTTVLLTRSSMASADESAWDGDLIAAGWSGAGVKPTGYDLKWVEPDKIVNGKLADTANPKTTYEEGLVAYIEIGSPEALAYFSHEVYADGTAYKSLAAVSDATRAVLYPAINTAKTSAQTALTALGTAKTSAQAVKTDIGTAKAAAQTAKTDAETVQAGATAENVAAAKATALAAYNSANTPYSTSNTVSNSANTASNNANTVVTNVNTIATKVAGAQTAFPETLPQAIKDAQALADFMKNADNGYSALADKAKAAADAVKALNTNILVQTATKADEVKTLAANVTTTRNDIAAARTSIGTARTNINTYRGNVNTYQRNLNVNNATTHTNLVNGLTNLIGAIEALDNAIDGLISAISSVESAINALSPGFNEVTAKADADFAEFNAAYAMVGEVSHLLDGSYVKLVNDIDLGGKMWIPIGQTDNVLTPGARFSGTFDGNGHTIYNLSTGGLFDNLVDENEDGSSYYIAYPSAENEQVKIPFGMSKSDKFCYGLFGYTANIKIKDVTIAGIDIYLDPSVESGLATIRDGKGDAVGALIGYGIGSTVLENCTVGSADTDNNIAQRHEGTAAGGVAGVLWAYDEGALEYAISTNPLELKGCTSYVNITKPDSNTGNKGDKAGGMVSFASMTETILFEKCTNFGDITGGWMNGGIMSYWSNGLALEINVIDCDNYGNIISSATGSQNGGILGNIQNSVLAGNTLTYRVQNCNNYGTIGALTAGGIIGNYRTVERMTGYLNHIYNYGDIYSTGKGNAGGLIGSMSNTGTEATDSSVDITGGNLGTVHRSGSTTNSLYGSASSFYDNTMDDCLDAGSVVTDTITDVTDIPTEHHDPVEHETYPDYSDAKDEGDYKYKDEVFAYADDNKTEIIALIKTDAIVEGTLEIPATVKKIGHAAFMSITEPALKAVKFAEGSELEEIGGYAFASTGLEYINLPSTVKKIGSGAFADCKALKQVDVNSDDVSLGNRAFYGTREVGGKAQGAYVILPSYAQYQSASRNYANCAGTLTYKVTINYIYNGSPLMVDDKDGEEGAKKAYVEVRLHGQDYKVIEGEGGLWIESDSINIVGPGKLGDYRWYFNALSISVASVGTMSDLLASVDGDVIELHANSSGTRGKEFVALGNLVYGNVHAVASDPVSFNSLLEPTRDQLTPGMKVTIHNDSTNVNVDAIVDAGTYTVTVVDVDNNVYSFEVVVSPASLNLATIENLEWHINGLSSHLMPYGESETLYIYTYSNDAKDEEGNSIVGQYPSLTPLSSAQIKELQLDNSYNTKEVQYSVVRNRGTEVTLVIVGEGYSVAYTEGSNVGKDVGVYTAKATLTSNGNYTFTLGNIDSVRELSITLNEDGTATVEKVWYIVDYANWLVVSDTDKSDYTLPDRVFGEGGVPAAPALYYTGIEGGSISMQLYYNDVLVTHTVGTNEVSVFTTGEMGEYINSAMPAGNYRLVVSVTGVTERIYEDDFTKFVDIYHNGFTETLTFTVSKANLSSNAVKAIHGLLKGKTFEFDVDKDAARLYSDEALNAVNTYLDSHFVRTGTIWADKKFDGYYDNYAIEYNFLRQHSDSYSVTPIDTSKVDIYTVYYRLTGRNYNSSIDDLNGEDRYDYGFTLIRYQMIAVPTLSAVTYSGNSVLPDIVDNSGLSSRYEVVWGDEEYVSGGVHSVTFKLIDNEDNLYRWIVVEGDDLKFDGSSVTRSFVIAQAVNDFSVALNLVGWNYGSYDKELNAISAAVRFLDKGEEIHFSVSLKGAGKAYEGLADFTLLRDKDGKLTGLVSDKIAAIFSTLPCGTYVLTASVNETANYKLPVNPSVEFVVGKAQNRWLLDEESGFSLPNWIKGRYSEEENPINIKALYGNVNFKIVNFETNDVYFDSTVNSADEMVSMLNNIEVGKYMLIAWVDGDANFSGLDFYTFTIEVFKRPGLPWWGTLLAVIGALAIAALIIFILWKKGVFRVITDKILIAIRTRVSVEATIASVRAAKMAEEGKKSVADAKRKERLEAAREKQRSMTPEERAAQLEAKAQADVARAEKLRAQSEANLAKAEKMRKSAPAEEKGEATSDAQSEAAATENPETPTEE